MSSSDSRIRGSAMILAIFISVMIALFMLLLIQVKKSSTEVAQRAITFINLTHLHDEFIRSDFSDRWAEGFTGKLQDDGFAVKYNNHRHGLLKRVTLSIQKGIEQDQRTYLLIPADEMGNNKFELRDNNRIIDIGYGVQANSPLLVPKGQVKPYKSDVNYNSSDLNLIPSSAYTTALDSGTYKLYVQSRASIEKEFLIIRDTLNPFDTVRAKVIHIEPEGYLQHNLLFADSVYVTGIVGCGQFFVRSFEMAPESSIQFPSLVFAFPDTISTFNFRSETDFRGFVYAYGVNHLVDKPRLVFYNNARILGDVFTNGSMVKFGQLQLGGRIRINESYKVNSQGKTFILDSIAVNMKNIFQGPYFSPESDKYKVVWYDKS